MDCPPEFDWNKVISGPFTSSMALQSATMDQVNEALPQLSCHSNCGADFSKRPIYIASQLPINHPLKRDSPRITFHRGQQGLSLL